MTGVQTCALPIYQVQEAQRVPYRINPRRNTPRHILTKLSKIKYKEQILKAAREKQQITHKGIPIRLTTDLSAETLQARRERERERGGQRERERERERESVERERVWREEREGRERGREIGERER